MIDSGAPVQEAAKLDGDQRCPRMRAGGTVPGVFAPHGVGRTAVEALYQHGYRHGWRVGDEQVQVVGFAGVLHQLDVEFGTPHAWFARRR